MELTRRNILHIGGMALTGVSAGCANLRESSDNDGNSSPRQGTTQTKSESRARSPEVLWKEPASIITTTSGSHPSVLVASGDAFRKLNARSGEQVWEVSTSDLKPFLEKVAHHGNSVYIAGRFGIGGFRDIYSLSTSGVLRWKIRGESIDSQFNRFNEFQGTTPDTLYVRGSLSGQEDDIFLDAASGQMRWRKQARPGTTIGNKTVCRYASSKYNTVIALEEEDGCERWQHSSSNLVRPDDWNGLKIHRNRVYTVTQTRGNERLSALDLGTGSTIWNSPIGPNAIIAATDDTLFAESQSRSTLSALNTTTGSKRWQFKSNPPRNSLFGFTDSSVYFVGRGPPVTLYSLDRETGEQLWSRSLSSIYPPAPRKVVVGRKRNAIYLRHGNDGNSITAFDKTLGEKCWNFRPSDLNIKDADEVDIDLQFHTEAGVFYVDSDSLTALDLINCQ